MQKDNPSTNFLGIGKENILQFQTFRLAMFVLFENYKNDYNNPLMFNGLIDHILFI